MVWRPLTDFAEEALRRASSSGHLPVVQWLVRDCRLGAEAVLASGAPGEALRAVFATKNLDPAPLGVARWFVQAYKCLLGERYAAAVRCAGVRRALRARQEAKTRASS